MDEAGYRAILLGLIVDKDATVIKGLIDSASNDVFSNKYQNMWCNITHTAGNLLCNSVYYCDDSEIVCSIFERSPKECQCEVMEHLVTARTGKEIVLDLWRKGLQRLVKDELLSDKHQCLIDFIKEERREWFWKIIIIPMVEYCHERKAYDTVYNDDVFNELLATYQKCAEPLQSYDLRKKFNKALRINQEL